jgi:hypothetical protein
LGRDSHPFSCRTCAAYKQNGEPGSSPFCSFLDRDEALDVPSTAAHRKSGVLNFVTVLGPVDSFFLPWSSHSNSLLRPRAPQCKQKIYKNEAPQSSDVKPSAPA